MPKVKKMITGCAWCRPTAPHPHQSYASCQGIRRCILPRISCSPARIRWKTYWKEQQALHGLCNRVKGDPSLKKEDVVVAYGAGQFGSTMVGKRPVPVKRFLNMLKEHVTVVLTPEYRTSRVCSNGCCQDQAGSAPGEDELVPMHAEKSKSGKKGRPLHAVRRCRACGTIWNRDVNAARNIARMFWYLREHEGKMPPWARPRPPQP